MKAPSRKHHNRTTAAASGPASRFSLSRLEISNEEILADLRYPLAAKPARRR